MKTAVTWMLLMVCGCGAFVATAQTRYEDYDDGYADEYAEREAERRDDGPQMFLFTPRIVDLVIDRVTEDMASQYAFDDDQLYQTRELIKERFPQWFQQNRGEIVSLANQYMEAILSGEPPSPEQVADWAQRAQPLFNEAFGMVEETADDMRTFMTEEQQVLMDGQIAMIRVGTGYLNRRLDRWSEGGYDWETEWPQSREFRERQREEERQLHADAMAARNEAMGLLDDANQQVDMETPPGARPQNKVQLASDAPPKDEWTVYVENFIRRYDLTEAQANTANKILRSLMEQRDQYLRRKLPAIREIKSKLEGADSDEKRDVIRAQLEQVNAPLERYFQQLKDRLERIPTRKQRAQAAKADLQVKAEPETSVKVEAAAGSGED